MHELHKLNNVPHGTVISHALHWSNDGHVGGVRVLLFH